MVGCVVALRGCIVCKLLTDSRQESSSSAPPLLSVVIAQEFHAHSARNRSGCEVPEGHNDGDYVKIAADQWSCPDSDYETINEEGDVVPRPSLASQAQALRQVHMKNFARSHCERTFWVWKRNIQRTCRKVALLHNVKARRCSLMWKNLLTKKVFKVICSFRLKAILLEAHTCTVHHHDWATSFPTRDLHRRGACSHPPDPQL